MKTLLNEQIRTADKKAVAQAVDKTPIVLFEENRCGNRMGKPGDANNVYYVSWFKFYSFGPDLTPRDEGLSLNFKDSTTNKPVPGGNGISEVDVIEAFRKAHPSHSVVILSIEPFKGDLAVKMNQALMKFKEDGQALLMLPPLKSPTKQAETIR